MKWFVLASVMVVLVAASFRLGRESVDISVYAWQIKDLEGKVEKAQAAELVARRTQDLINENIALKPPTIPKEIERWQAKAVWRKLSKGDSTDSVKALLGEPKHILNIAGIRQIWNYTDTANQCDVTFEEKGDKWLVLEWDEPFRDP